MDDLRELPDDSATELLSELERLDESQISGTDHGETLDIGEYLVVVDRPERTDELVVLSVRPKRDISI